MNENNFIRTERLWIVAVLAAAVASLLVWRWHTLQVDRFQHFSELARENQVVLLPVEPPRGLIFDRSGKALAVNETVYSLKVGSDYAAEVLSKIDVLRGVIYISERAIKKLIKARDSSVYQGSIALREKLNEQEIIDFLSWQFLFPEIILETELARRYSVVGDVSPASHVIGHVGRLNDSNIKKLKAQGVYEDYQGAKFIGKTGVELIYENLLRGELGVQEAQVDAHGRILDSKVRRQPIPGRDLHLTLDMELQQQAEFLLEGERGAVVMMDIKTGALLALASSPRFDLNHFVFGISHKNWDALNTSEDRPLIHRAIYGQYAPGSTIKPFSALVALKKGWRDEKYTYFSTGYFHLTPSVKFADWKAGGHGKVDIAKSIIRSVNSFYYKLGHDVGMDALREELLPFGFGSASGVDLDNEKGGVLPSEAWKKKTYGEQWYPGDTISASVGQGYVQVTPLQMAVAMAMIANGGERLRPYVFRGPKEDGKITISKAHFSLVRKALAAVTRPGGTASRVGKDAVYGIAGKTGTAQVSRLRLDAAGRRIKNENLPKKIRDHAWFVGYAPVNAPQVAVAVLVENGGSGGSTAGPIARHLLDKYLVEDGHLPMLPPRPEAVETDNV
jgi:penicillin-binding protein 2